MQILDHRGSVVAELGREPTCCEISAAARKVIVEVVRSTVAEMTKDGITREQIEAYLSSDAVVQRLQSYHAECVQLMKRMHDEPTAPSYRSQ